MPIYDVPVRELLRRFVTENHVQDGELIPKTKITNWFRVNYPKIKSSTVNAQTILMTTNAKARVYYGADVRNDLFFQVDSGHLRIYRPDSDPAPIYAPGKSQIRSASVGQGPDEDDEDNDQVEKEEFAYEADLKNYLAANLSKIEAGLQLYDKIEGLSGIEFPVGGRFIDILATDKSNNFAVIELKVSRGYDRVVGQLLRYMGWVQANLARSDQLVRGVIIASSISEDLILACSRLVGVDLYEYRLAVSLSKIPMKNDARPNT